MGQYLIYPRLIRSRERMSFPYIIVFDRFMSRNFLISLGMDEDIRDHTLLDDTQGGGRAILVTGGCGFIGCHLIRELLRRGNFVYCIDSLITGSVENAFDFRNNPRFVLINQDVIDPIIVKKSVRQVYHLACAASPSQYQRDPLHTMRTNVNGAFNICEFARRCSARVLLASTSEVYGDPIIHPQSEENWGNVNPIGPRACYDEGKRAAETIFTDYRRMHGLEIRIARIFNTYGPGMSLKDGRVVSNFIVEALEGKRLSVYGDGSQTRSFCYVSDMVSGLIALMESDAGNLESPVNLGNPEEFSIKQLACIVRESLPISGKDEYHPLPQDDPKRRRPDIARAMEYLSWEPRVSLREGLGLTISDFKRRHQKGMKKKSFN